MAHNLSRPDALRKREAIRAMLSSMGVDKFENGLANLQCGCPMAEFSSKHKHKKDNRPSMGIRVDTHGKCAIHCFTCGFKADSLTSLITELSRCDERYTPFVKQAEGIEHLSLLGEVSLLDEYKLAGPESYDYRVFRADSYEVYAHRFHTYLTSRGVTVEMAKRWNLGFDSQQRRITFPVYTTEQEFVGMVGRAVDASTQPRYWNYWHFDRSCFLLGENLFVPGNIGVLVEGPLDAVVADWYLHNHGYSVVSAMGVEVGGKQMLKLLSMAKEIILLLDNDIPGKEMSRKLQRRYQDKIKLRVAQYPLIDGKECHDPAELAEGCLAAVQGARWSALS